MNDEIEQLKMRLANAENAIVLFASILDQTLPPDLSDSLGRMTGDFMEKSGACGAFKEPKFI